MKRIPVALLCALAIVAAQGRTLENSAGNKGGLFSTPGDGIDVTRLFAPLPAAVTAGSDAAVLAHASSTAIQTTNIASEEPVIVRRLDAWGMWVSCHGLSPHACLAWTYVVCAARPTRVAACLLGGPS
jgi:hypothetical protein